MGDWISGHDGVTVTLVLGVLGLFLAEGGWGRRQMKRIHDALDLVDPLRHHGFHETASRMAAEGDRWATRFLDRKRRWREHTMGWSYLVWASAWVALMLQDDKDSSVAIGATALFVLGFAVFAVVAVLNGALALAAALKGRAEARRALASDEDPGAGY